MVTPVVELLHVADPKLMRPGRSPKRVRKDTEVCPHGPGRVSDGEFRGSRREGGVAGSGTVGGRVPSGEREGGPRTGRERRRATDPVLLNVLAPPSLPLGLITWSLAGGTSGLCVVLLNNESFVVLR